MAFVKWNTEAMIRENQKKKLEQGCGWIKPQCARVLLDKLDHDLDFPSGSQVQSPDPPDLDDAQGLRRTLHSPPPYDGQKAESTTRLYAEQHADRDLLSNSPSGKGCEAPLEPHVLTPGGPLPGWETIRDRKGSCILMPIVDVLNPRGDVNDPEITYVFCP